MDYAMGFIEQTLIDSMETASGLKALEAYTLASTHGMKRIAKTAALVMLKQPFDAIGFTEMKRTGTTLAQAWRLFDYRKRVESRLACFVKDEQWPYKGDVYQKWEEIDNPKLACTICLDPKARRRAWSHWKPTMLHEIHKAPLGDSVADYASLRNALHLSYCSSCEALLAQRGPEICDMFRSTFYNLASEVRLKYLHLLPSKAVLILSYRRSSSRQSEHGYEAFKHRLTFLYALLFLLILVRCVSLSDQVQTENFVELTIKSQIPKSTSSERMKVTRRRST